MIANGRLWPIAKRFLMGKRTPAWLRAIARGYARRFVMANVSAIGEALEEGAGLHEQAWPPGTPVEAILRWFDETIAAQPQIGILDHNSMSVLQGREEELAPCIWMHLPIPPGALLANWSGTRAGWWREGRDIIAAAIPADHQGLYTVTDSAGTAYQQRFRSRPEAAC